MWKVKTEYPCDYAHNYFVLSKHYKGKLFVDDANCRIDCFG